MEVGGSVPRDHAQPTAERGAVAQRVDLLQRDEEDLLHQIIRLRRTNAGQEDAVDRGREPAKEAPERRSVAPLGRLDIVLHIGRRDLHRFPEETKKGAGSLTSRAQGNWRPRSPHENRGD
ncbi:Hypothetical protein A7982_05470 [Minicystis rosea]|nr:Hypothetical protein A7982_05470 [Minicystis rosea]